MKKNITPNVLDLFLSTLLDRKPSWYNNKREEVEKLLLFILENDLVIPEVVTITCWDNDPPIDDELNFCWDFYHPELDGLVYIDSGFCNDNDGLSYYIKLGEKIKYEMIPGVKEFLRDDADPYNPFPEEVVKYLKKL